MKLVVTGTRGIPDIMAGVETHCKELLHAVSYTHLTLPTIA